MNKELQSRAPIMEALQDFKVRRVVPFDVPGHKRGRGVPELSAFLGARALDVDVNSMKSLDFLCHPVSVIKQAEEIAADAFGAAHALLMVGGATSAVQAMILSVCKKGDKILLARNCHRSALSALVLAGALPCYIDPGTHHNLGIPMGMRLKDIRRAIDDNPDAKAIFLNNPTYYGVCSNLREIVALAHARGMQVLVDEAHGTHFAFGKDLPISAMAAGADMAAISMHKSGGSLTQSAFLLLGKNPNPAYIRQIVNLTQTTSGSYLLLASLDISRKNLALNGNEIFAKVCALADYARAEINNIGGFYAFNKEIIDGDAIYDFDSTKLSVNSLKAGLAGREVFDLLRDEYEIQIEFGDVGNFLAYISMGDSLKEVERLCSALSEIYRIYRKDHLDKFIYEYVHPIVVMPPQEAFYGQKDEVLLTCAPGRISCELAMLYPPGVPVLAPGELITTQAVDYIQYAKSIGCTLTGTMDENMEKILVLR